MQSTPDPADLPALLAYSGQYLADLQKQLSEISQQRDALKEEKRALHTQLTVAKREKATVAANLQAEIASMQARLDQVGARAAAQTEQLRAAQQREAELQAAAEAAISGRREEVAGLQERIQQLEALCAQQAGQLGELPTLRQQMEQQAAELERRRHTQAAADEKYTREMEALKAERDEARSKHFKYKRLVREQAQAYQDLKDKIRRTKRESQQELRQVQDQQQAQAQARELGVGQQQQAPRGGREAPAVPPQRPARTHSVASSGEEGSGSYQLHLSVSETAPQRLPSVSSPEALAQHSAPAVPTAKQQVAEQSSWSRPVLPLTQRGSAATGSARWQIPRVAAVSPLQRRLEPPLEADPPQAEEVWPVEDLPQIVPSTEEAELPGSEAEDEGSDADLTQEVPPPTALIVCTQLPQPAQSAWVRQQQQQQESHGGHWQQQQVPSGGVARVGSNKRPQQWHVGGEDAILLRTKVLPAGQQGAAAAGSMPPPPLRSKRRAVSAPELLEATPPKQQQHCRRNQHQQRQKQQHDLEWSPLAAAAEMATTTADVHPAIVHRQTVAWEGGLPQGAGWPTSWPTGPQQQQRGQQGVGGGWKQAVRDHAPAHAAFELGASHAGNSAAPGNRPGSFIPPPLREANGPPTSSRASGGGGGSGGSGDGNGNGDTGYRYQAVVRKKAEREKLQGVECQQCKRFYAALESWGTIGQEQVRLECGHVQQANVMGNGGPGGPAALNRAQLQQEGSRHRYMWKPPDTQEGFWDLDVTQKSPAKRRHPEAVGQQQQQQAAGEQVFWQAEDHEHPQQQQQHQEPWG